MLDPLITQIPHQISAKTFSELQALMLKINIATYAKNQYFDIQFVNGKWYAHFYTDDVNLEKKVNINEVQEKEIKKVTKKKVSKK